MLRLEYERRKRNMSKNQLAFETKISPCTIGKLEASKLYAYPGYKKKLEEYFGISGDGLFEEVDENGRKQLSRTCK